MRERSIRIVKRKVSPSVRIHLTNGFSGGNYARKYSYGNKPFPVNNQHPREYYHNRPNKKYFGKRDGRNGSKNYANGYRTWGPPNRGHNGKYNLRIDQGKRGVQSPYRKDPYPFVRDPIYKNVKKRPLRGNQLLQRPKPPRALNEFDDDYYFPEEANKVDNKHEFEAADSKSKKRRKNVPEIYKRPEYKGGSPSSYQFGDKKPGYFRKKIKDTGPASYGSFTQQTSNNNNDEDYNDDEAEGSQQNKDEDYQSEQIGEDGNDGYHQASYVDDYDPTERSSKKQSKKSSSYETNEENQKNYRAKTQQQQQQQHLNNPLSSTPESHAGNFKQNSQDNNSPFSPSYSPPWSQVVGSTAQPPIPSSYNTINRYQLPQYQNQYPPINNPPPNSYPFLSQNPQYNNYPQNQYNYQTQTNQFGYNQQQQQPQNYLNSQQIQSSSTQQTNYYSPPQDNTYKNFIVNSQYGTASSQSNDNPPPSITSSYAYQTFPTNGLVKKNPFEGTESFYNNNNNNYYVKSQSLSYLDNSHKYSSSTRLSVPYQNSQTKIASDDENDFLKKHQNLYNKGVSGIPIQGDGYGKDPPKKDYDIGYGDFQFDENPTT
ncbi:conserved hypothetical protein [Pediculus humanus corporis]|uniref:Uncharacterized protein n=1 Tax=Pediculus humanus subsp. corporis TaxID=121224 RepID=E0VT18_PEDHC|nr:uncharacterized protein Phum_PHUM425200 [Pediculus humanus corporis]EEB16524.1 conserved hypothetical protein [Pediculus humanus corporis]